MDNKIDFGKLFMAAIDWKAVDRDADKICAILARGKQENKTK